MPLYEDLLQNRDAKLIAGGAAQNTARAAQVGISQSPSNVAPPQAEPLTPPFPN